MENYPEKDFVFVWTIEKLSMFGREKENYLCSPVFIAENLGNSQWSLAVSSNGDYLFENNSVVFINLCRHGDYVPDEEAICLELAFSFGLTKVNILKSSRRKFIVGLCDFLFFEIDSKFLETVNISADDILTISFSMSKSEIKHCITNRCEITTKVVIDQYSFQCGVDTSSSLDWTVSKVSPVLHSKQITALLSKEFLHFKITSTDESGKKYLLMKLRITLFSVDGVAETSKSYIHLFRSYDPWEFDSFINMGDLKDRKDVFLKSGVFSFKCEIFVPSGEIVHNAKYESNTTFPSKENTISVLQKDLKNMLIKGKYTDINFRVKNKLLSAHRSILSSRSPVFEAMFAQNMTESQTGIIDLEDVDENSFQPFLEFLYTGETQAPDYRSALELLILADKYQVQSLISYCSTYLISAFTTENIFEIVSLADMLGHELLKNAALDYAKIRVKHAFASDGWKKLCKSNCELGSEVLLKFSS